MIAKTAAGRSGTRLASATKPVAITTRKPSVAQRAPANADDFSDVMKTLEQVGVKNDELAVRINRLVTSLR